MESPGPEVGRSRGPGRTSGRARAALVGLVAGYLVLDLVAGAPQSPLVPALPPGVAVPGWVARGAEGLGLTQLGRTGLTGIALGLLAALLGAVTVLLWEAWRGRVRAGPVLLAAALSLGLSVAAPPLLSRDLYSYAAYGRTWARYRSNPYALSPSAFPADPFVRAASPEWRDTPSLYGPAFVLAAGVVSRVAPSPQATLLGLKALAGVALFGAAALAARAAGIVRPGLEAFAAAALGLNPVMVVHAVGGGHNDALIALCLAGALLLSVGADPSSRERGPGSQREVKGEGREAVPTRPRSGAVLAGLAVTALLTVAVLIKVVVAPAMAVWAWHVGRRARRARRGPTTAAAHVGVALGLGAVLFAPFFAGWRTLSPLATLGGVRGWASGPGLVARGAAAAATALGGPAIGNAVSSSVSAAFLGGYALVLWRLLTGRRARDRADARGPAGPRGATGDPRPLQASGLPPASGHVEPPPVGPEWTPAEDWGPALLLFALAAPYLLPWYAAWFLPFLAAMADRRLVLVALTVAGVLSLTGVPAEPGSMPALWDRMVLGVHYGAAPLMLALSGAAVVALRGAPETIRGDPTAGGGWASGPGRVGTPGPGTGGR